MTKNQEIEIKKTVKKLKKYQENILLSRFSIYLKTYLL